MTEKPGRGPRHARPRRGQRYGDKALTSSVSLNGDSSWLPWFRLVAVIVELLNDVLGGHGSWHL